MAHLVVGPGRGESAGPFPEGGLRQRVEFRQCGREYGRSKLRGAVSGGRAPASARQTLRSASSQGPKLPLTRRGVVPLVFVMAHCCTVRRLCRSLGGGRGSVARRYVETAQGTKNKSVFPPSVSPAAWVRQHSAIATSKKKKAPALGSNRSPSNKGKTSVHAKLMLEARLCSFFTGRRSIRPLNKKGPRW